MSPQPPAVPKRGEFNLIKSTECATTVMIRNGKIVENEKGRGKKKKTITIDDNRHNEKGKIKK